MISFFAALPLCIFLMGMATCLVTGIAFICFGADERQIKMFVFAAGLYWAPVILLVLGAVLDIWADMGRQL